MIVVLCFNISSSSFAMSRHSFSNRREAVSFFNSLKPSCITKSGTHEYRIVYGTSSK